MHSAVGNSIEHRDVLCISGDMHGCTAVQGAVHLYLQIVGRPAGGKSDPNAAVRQLLSCCNSWSSIGPSTGLLGVKA